MAAFTVGSSFQRETARDRVPLIVEDAVNRVPNMMCLAPYALAPVLVACVKVRKAK